MLEQGGCNFLFFSCYFLKEKGFLFPLWVGVDTAKILAYRFHFCFSYKYLGFVVVFIIISFARYGGISVGFCIFVYYLALFRIPWKLFSR